MSGGNNIVGLWPNKQPPVIAEPEAHLPEAAEAHYDAYAEEYATEKPPREWGLLVGRIACIALALGWTAYCGWSLAQRGLSLATFAPETIATLAAPLALIGIVWVLILRSSKAEAARFATTIEHVRAEEARLAATLDAIAARIDLGRAALAGESEVLSQLGTETATRLHAASDTMRGEVEVITRHAGTLKTSAAAARADMAVLLSDLPKAQVQARQMTSALIEAGVQACEKAEALEAQLGTLKERGREASDFASGATQQLAAHLAQVASASAEAQSAVAASGMALVETVDAALGKSAEAMAAARDGMEAQSEALLAMTEQAAGVMRTAGERTGTEIASRLADASALVETLATRFAEQQASSGALVAQLTGDMEGIEARFETLGSKGTDNVERASAAVLALRDHGASLSETLDAGGQLANSLIGQAETLLTALDAASREIDETMPAALERVTSATAQASALTREVRPELEALDKHAAEALGSITATQALLEDQRAALAALVRAAETSLERSRASVETLTGAIDTANARTLELADTSAPRAAEAVAAVGAQADAAATSGRAALAAIVPESAQALADHSRDALVAALTEQVEQQMAEIGRTTEAAVATAQKATDRLMRQMLTISETSSALETRIAEAKDEVEAADQSNFSRRIALLVESLNSTSIDVTKILSNDVTDTAWSAYLRGDRGVFTRRAVRLLDAGEAREIAVHYESDGEFKDHVNRYIHDFEAMLRNVLSTRDGGPLSVTLLSSDAGKLYVALAQAIDRLRS